MGPQDETWPEMKKVGQLPDKRRVWPRQTEEIYRRLEHVKNDPGQWFIVMVFDTATAAAAWKNNNRRRLSEAGFLLAVRSKLDEKLGKRLGELYVAYDPDRAHDSIDKDVAEEGETTPKVARAIIMPNRIRGKKRKE